MSLWARVLKNAVTKAKYILNGWFSNRRCWKQDKECLKCYVKEMNDRKWHEHVNSRLQSCCLWLLVELYVCQSGYVGQPQFDHTSKIASIFALPISYTCVEHRIRLRRHQSRSGIGDGAWGLLYSGVDMT